MTIVLGGSVLTVEPVFLSRLPEIKYTQQILSFLISIVLFICLISFIIVIYSLSTRHRTNTYEPIIIIIWIFFFASGLFITERYYHNGLLVFAWLGIVNVILTCTIIVVETVEFVIINTKSSEQIAKIPIIAIPIYTCLTSVILDAIIVIFTFKLSNLMTKNKDLIDHQQI